MIVFLLLETLMIGMFCAIDTLLLKYEKQRAEYEFTTTNKTLHKLWVINDENDISSITKNFNKIENLYIADGHHRCASSSLLT